MKASLALFCVLIASCALCVSAAQQGSAPDALAEFKAKAEAERKLLAEIRTKAEKGDVAAQYELGQKLFLTDESEAVKWLLKATEANHNGAFFYLGLHFSAAGDAKKAFAFNLRGAQLGSIGCAYFLGTAYLSGTGTEKDVGEGLRWVKKSADGGYISAQSSLAHWFHKGGMDGVAKDLISATHYYRMLAELKNSSSDAAAALEAQRQLGSLYAEELKDYAEAIKWYRMAANQNDPFSQFQLGYLHAEGAGVPKDEAEAVKWYRKSAEQNFGFAQHNLGNMYSRGQGVVKDEIQAYKWWLLAGAQGLEPSRERYAALEQVLTAEQRAEGQRLAREFKPVKPKKPADIFDRIDFTPADTQPRSSGTGFFITEDGYFITNQHVAGEGATVRLVTAIGTIAAKIVKVDKANDLALLKAEGKFTALPVITSRGVRLGATAATVGFPNTGLQGFAPKLAKGEIASLAGAQDDARHFQISAPIQPGNSGGALVDERGNVIGVVVAKLNQKAALATSGALAENVNYAVKSSYLLSFLESVPEVAAKLKEPATQPRKFEDVVKSVEQATVLVLVY